MAILKNKTQGQYVNIYKNILKDHALNLRDRGMVVTLLSLPNNWEFSISGLSKIIPDGKSAIQASLTHLEELGYLSREQGRAEHGKFGRNVIEIHEKPVAPQTDFPSTEKRFTENPVAENRPQYINNKYNNKLNNNLSIHHSDREEGWRNIAQVKEVIAENIHLEEFYEVAGEDTSEQEMIREIYDTICDVVCFPRENMTIKGINYPWQVVKSQFMKLKPVHISNLLKRLMDNRLEIKNMDSKIIPYFKNKSLAEITATDIIQWQNQLLSMRDENEKPYSQTYLRTVQNQLSAIFNHACRFYGLTNNPSKQAGKMGKAKGKEMLFWTKEEYLKFAEVMKEKPVSYYAFEVLYWTGIREGELLALEKGDFHLKERKLYINKFYQHLQGEDYITSPKTEKSNRVIELPEFLCKEMEDYFGMFYKCEEHTRLFSFSKSYLYHEMNRGSKAAGVKRIRIHDLRHSHVAHCIELGFSPVAIAERMGHEGINITYNYAHLYPSKQKALAEKLNEDRGDLDKEMGVEEL